MACRLPGAQESAPTTTIARKRPRVIDRKLMLRKTSRNFPWQTCNWKLPELTSHEIGIAEDCMPAGLDRRCSEFASAASLGLQPGPVVHQDLRSTTRAGAFV